MLVGCCVPSSRWDGTLVECSIMVVCYTYYVWVFVRFCGLAILICGYLGTGVNRCAVICVYVCECVFIYNIVL